MPKPIVCLGAALIDEVFTCLHPHQAATSNPANYRRFAGGVARNVAHHLALLGHDVELVSHFGDDADGQWLRHQCTQSGIGYRFSCISPLPTGRYAAILSPDGELVTAASVSNLEQAVTPHFLQTHLADTGDPALLVADCNLGEESLEWLLHFARSRQIPIVVEPVSVSKAARLKHLDLSGVLLITPGEAELAALLHGSDRAKKGIQNLWLRKGKNGSTLLTPHETLHFPAPEVDVVDTTGAGDAALAGWIHAWISGKNPQDCIGYGHALAALVLQTRGAVNENLNEALLQTTYENQLLK